MGVAGRVPTAAAAGPATACQQPGDLRKQLGHNEKFGTHEPEPRTPVLVPTTRPPAVARCSGEGCPLEFPDFALQLAIWVSAPLVVGDAEDVIEMFSGLPS